MSGQRLSTKQAEQRAGVSRFVLMRAQKAGELLATKDNKGRWVWSKDELDAWAAARPVEPVPNVPKRAEKVKEPSADVGALLRSLGVAEGRAQGLEIALDLSQNEIKELRRQVAELQMNNAEQANRPLSLWSRLFGK
jgi:uncharacterized UBP type Zn finger protein